MQTWNGGKIIHPLRLNGPSGEPLEVRWLADLVWGSLQRRGGVGSLCVVLNEILVSPRFNRRGAYPFKFLFRQLISFFASSFRWVKFFLNFIFLSFSTLDQQSHLIFSDLIWPHQLFWCQVQNEPKRRQSVFLGMCGKFIEQVSQSS